MASKELSILLTAKNLASRTIGKVSKDIGGLGKMSRTASAGVRSLTGNVAKFGLVAAAGLGAMVKSGIDALAESEAVGAQTVAVIKSTGKAAHVTAGQVDELASALQRKAAIDDDEIKAGANMLLTFTNIRNEAGKGNDIFNQTLATLTDMSVAMGGDMSKSAIQLGKALNDPVKGVGALSKVGVTFDATQKKRIAQFVKEGKVTKAQAIILAELNKEFGGSGAAAAGTYAGKMRLLGFAVEDAQKALAEGFLPVLLKIADWMGKKLADPAVIADIKSLGQSLAGAFDKAATMAMNIPWDSIKDAMRLAGQGAKAAYDLFTGLPPWVQTAVVTGWGLNKLTGGALSSIVGQLGAGLIKGVLGINAGVVNLRAATVVGAGPVGTGTAVTGGGGKLGRIGSVAATVGKVFLVGMAAAAAAELAGQLGQQSAEIRQQGEDLKSQTKTFVADPKTGTAAIVAAINSIDQQMADPFNALALAITDPLNGGKAALEQTRATLAQKLTAIRAEEVRLHEQMGGVRAALLAKDWSPKVNVVANFSATISVRTLQRAVAVNQRYQSGGRIL
jgi:hypothetical protein